MGVEIGEREGIIIINVFMTQIDVEVLDRQVISSESLVIKGEVHLPFVQIIPQMLGVVRDETQKQQNIGPDELYQKLLGVPGIDMAAKKFNPDRYAGDKPRALVSLLNFICELNTHALNNISTILTKPDLEKLKELQEKISRVDTDKPEDVLVVLSVANILIPNLIQDQDYVINYRPPTPTTTGGGDYGPATGRFEINQWAVDFRQFKNDSNLINQLLKIEK